MKATMENNKDYDINVFLEKFYFDDDHEDDESSDTYRLLKEQLGRIKKTVRGKGF